LMESARTVYVPMSFAYNEQRSSGSHTVELDTYHGGRSQSVVSLSPTFVVVSYTIQG
jgi:hypothetical protein